MTYQTDHIQAMISEIDRVLRQTQSRTFWTFFTRYRLQRQLLERCRNFLVMQQRPASVHLLATSTSASTTSASTASTASTASSTHGTSSNPTVMPEAMHQMYLEIQRLRQEVMQPLRSDVAALDNQRTALHEEVQSLLLQKAQLQADCETLRLKLTHPIPVPPQSTASRSLAIDEAEVARLEALHERTDFLLSSLDSSLQLAFGAMQKNVDVYQTTLHQGLDRMHHLGYQGEVMFSTLVNRLAQQVGREVAAVFPDPSSRIPSAIEQNPESMFSQISAKKEYVSSHAQQARFQETQDLTPDGPVSDRVDATNSAMQESIDFFFADFSDETSTTQRQTVQPQAETSPVVTQTSHEFLSSSSLNIIPQQVDLEEESTSLDRDPIQYRDQTGSDRLSITINDLFESLEEKSLSSFPEEMTLTEMDELFADVPAL